jgi:pimeloyl-ACP methyl ester carboxylesterase
VNSRTTRRVFLGTAAGAVAVGMGAAAIEGPRTLAKHLRDDVLGTPPVFIPDAPEGRITLETVHSKARGQDVSLFIAVPAGYGDGKGLPVCLILHGASARPPDYRGFGFGRFLTAAVRRGSPPFVLAGADGGLLWWEPGREAGDDPRAMVTDEMPVWLAQRGFDVSKPVAWGWSMGGYGVLGLAEHKPGWLRAVAALSPAVEPGDAVFSSSAALSGQPLGVWCGTSDPLYDNIRQFVRALPQRPEIVQYGPGAHTRQFWDSVTLPAFAFLGSHLA